MSQSERAETEATIEAMEGLGIAALQNALRVHNELGEDGLTDIPVNRYRTTLKGDMEAESAVIDTLEEGDFSFLIHAEENGIVTFGERQDYLAVLYGIDGSKSYIEKFGEGRYATMLGIFANIDPTYDDYMFS